MLWHAEVPAVLAVVTLASPHQRSPAHVQPALARFYRRLSTMAAPPVPVVSIAGGAADVQVHRSPSTDFAAVMNSYEWPVKKLDVSGTSSQEHETSGHAGAEGVDITAKPGAGWLGL